MNKKLKALITTAILVSTLPLFIYLWPITVLTIVGSALLSWVIYTVYSLILNFYSQDDDQ